MVQIKYDHQSCHTHPKETLLDTFLRKGIRVPFSCRSGTCQICTLRCSKGKIPEKAQIGLRPALIQKNYLLACQCIPEEDMELTPANPEDLFSGITVYAKKMLRSDVCKVLLETTTPMFYHPGQYINLRRWDGLIRSYSLASVPSLDSFLEIHVKAVPKGRMTEWIFERMQTGLNLEFQGPQGHCYYRASLKDKPLLLIGTGTGLAPLLGIARDALNSGHRSDIYLYHGSRHQEGLYLDKDLRKLASHHTQFHYIPCLSGPNAPEGFHQGRADNLALKQHSDLSGWAVYLCGHPDMVKTMRTQAIALGAQQEYLYTDAFETSGSQESDSQQDMKHQEEEHIFPPPDLELWKALKHGVLLTVILEDFYTQVYADPELAPFFSVTKEHITGQQYSFLYEILTGKDVYFGELPRNAHHWMVISDRLFDHRAQLLENTLRKHGLSEKYIQRFMELEESFRSRIVKKEPWPKIAFGREFPLEGYEEIDLEFGGLCDGCASVIEAGEKVKYHLRLGTVYCPPCSV